MEKLFIHSQTSTAVTSTSGMDKQYQWALHDICNYSSMLSILGLKHVTPCHITLDHDTPLRWRHNEGDSVSNHQPHDCLLNRLFRRRSKKTSKLRVTGLCAGNSPGTGEFPAQMASYAENVSIWWRHHGRTHDVISWKRFLYYWPFVTGSYHLLVDSPLHDFK